MCLQPICAPAKVGAEWHLHPVGALHGLDDDALHQLLLLGVDAEVEFVVYLEYHRGAQALGTEAAVDLYHGYLDDVGRAALDGCVDGVALGIAAHYAVV